MGAQEKFITSDKIFSHLNRLKKWRDGEEVYPITVEIHPTDLCNNKCHYCEYRKETASIDRKQFITVLKRLRHIGVKGVILSGGGEPLLNPEAGYFLQMIRKNGFDAALITNLNVYNNDLFRSILETTEWCRISLDACTGRTYKKIRGVDRFDRAVDNIRRLVRLKERMRSRTTIGIQMVVCKENMREIAGIIKLSSTLRVDYIHIRPLEILPRKPLPYSEQDYRRVCSQIEKAGHMETSSFEIIFSNKWDIVNPNHRGKSHGFTFCHGYPFIGAVDARGDYYACCHKVENREKKFCYGNIISEPAKKIMSRRKRIARKITLKDCYLECRGSNLNRRLESLLRGQEHKNFL